MRKPVPERCIILEHEPRISRQTRSLTGGAPERLVVDGKGLETVFESKATQYGKCLAAQTRPPMFNECFHGVTSFRQYFL
ncbi:hypothetical protein AGR4A_Cc190357 [Agrobacterium tumefaciens str. B6]|uniref:Uncharacterized protein n=1 Tax=Agrobacterium tumefaciens str. B6 TaxID=1183423 RepID=A0A822UXU2_AGRTU|nr:hypothetical protein AGR4A_Cc190357 [Agrobacterium tumefaciens str. B6]